MKKLMELLDIQIPKYDRKVDPIFSIATPLHACELDSKASQDLTFPDGLPYPPKKVDLNNYVRLECGNRAPPKPCKVSKRNEEPGPDASTCNEDEEKSGSQSSSTTVNVCVKGWFGNNWGMKTKKRR